MSWKDIIETKGSGIIINSEIDKYLESKGFEKDTPVSANRDSNLGWQLGYYPDSDHLYYDRININKDRIVFYREYDCGGAISDWEKEIEDTSVFDSIEKFDEYMESINFN